MYKHKESTWKIDSNNNYEEVNEFIEKKIKKIKTTREDLTSIESLFNNYITITKNYCEQIALLALQIKPLANTIEGDLAQAIQGIFLFNIDSLETLAKNIEIFFLNRTKKDTGVNVIEEFSKLYQINLSEALGKYCLYIEEIEKYEKFLMNKEILKNENEKYNINNVLKKRKDYINKIEPVNDIINKIVEYSIKEEKILNEEYYDISKMFINELNQCLENQKNKYKDQMNILEELCNKLKEEKYENLNLGKQIYSLHCLNIYINSKKLLREKNKEENNLSNSISKEFELYKNITIENVENIIKEMKRNGLEIKEEDLEDFELEKIKDYIENKIKYIYDKKDENFNEEDKNKIIKYFEDNEEFILFFLQILNNDRAKGGKIYNINIFNYLGEIFKKINDKILSKNDYKCFKYITIISMTYYILEENTNKKKYLYNFIKDNNKLKEINFWQNYIKEIVDLDKKKDLGNEEEYIIDENIQKKINFIAFSNVLSITNNMVNFGFDKNFINNFINFTEINYSLTKEQIQQLNDMIIIWTKNTENNN